MLKNKSRNMLRRIGTSLIIVICLQLTDFCDAQSPPAAAGRSGSSSNEVPAKYYVGYRKVSWCVTGKDEPELHEWPFSQFVPILRRWNREKHDPNVRYDLRFYDIDSGQPEVGFLGRLYKTIHVVLKAEKRLDPIKHIPEIFIPMQIEGVLIQANSNPYALALPFGQFFPPGDHNEKFDSEVHCFDCNHTLWARNIACRKRAKIHVEHPTIMAWHFMQESFSTPPDTQDGGIKEPTEIKFDSRQTEVHANFRWYSPKCAPVRRMMFTIMVVRSFVNHEYDIFHRGPYEVTLRGQNYQSDIHPSPYYYFYTQHAACHKTSASDLTLEHPAKFREFEMNAVFDCCIREEENRKTRITHELLGTKNQPSTSCKEKIYQQRKAGEKFDARTIPPGEESPVCFFPFAPKYCYDYEIEKPYDEYPPCEACVEPLTTTTVLSTQKPFSIYKRTMHGGLMIMTNFCLQPIVIYVARFYKETFNANSYKGAKSWYLMHLFGGFVSSSMVYLGYFSGGDDEAPGIKNHVAIGKVYIVTLGLCYCSAWGRHKNNAITIIAEFVHGCFGYVTIILALFSIMSAPGMQAMSKLLVLLMVCTQGFFMLILTCQICVLDRRFGMRPKRRHFPTVEARFDEVEVPGGKFRIWMLVIFSAITFSLSTASTFFD